MQLQGIVFIQLQRNYILVSCQGNTDSFKEHIFIHKKYNHSRQLYSRPVGRGGARGAHPPRSQKGAPDGIVKDLKSYKYNREMVRLAISMHFQQFEDLKFRFFFSGGACPRTPSAPQKTPYRVSKRPELGGIVPVLLENPESGLNFSRDTSIPILNNSSHKPTSREIYVDKIVIIFVIA